MMKMLDARPISTRAVAVRSKDDPFLLLSWRISLFGEKGSVHRKVVKLALSKSGHRLPEKEHLDFLGGLPPVHLSPSDFDQWLPILDTVPAALERDLKYRGLLTGNTSFQSELIGVLIGS